MIEALVRNFCSRHINYAGLHGMLSAEIAQQFQQPHDQSMPRQLGKHLERKKLQLQLSEIIFLQACLPSQAYLVLLVSSKTHTPLPYNQYPELLQHHRTVLFLRLSSCLQPSH